MTKIIHSAFAGVFLMATLTACSPSMKFAALESSATTPSQGSSASTSTSSPTLGTLGGAGPSSPLSSPPTVGEPITLAGQDPDKLPVSKCPDNSLQIGVIICHVPPGNSSAANTLCIGQPAIQAHLSHHDDYLGGCGGKNQ